MMIRSTPVKNRRISLRNGSVLLLVLVVVAIFTLASFTFFDLMFGHEKATDGYGRKLQATSSAESGVEFLLKHLAKTPEEIELAGGLYDNSAWFRGVPVVIDDDARRTSRFSILAPAMVNGVYDGARFGLENESGRINLNTILTADSLNEGTARDLLLNLPGMDEFIADAILDWLDPDDTIRDFGAESEYYSALQPPYSPTNGPLQTIEQLLLVRGVTPELLYGADINRNFIVDADESARTNMVAANNADGSMNRGWSAFFTLYSAETNLREDGTPKIDINGDDLETLHTELLDFFSDDQANFIIAFRQGGPFDEEQSSEEVVSAGSLDLDYEQSGGTKLTTILDLIGTKTRTVEQEDVERKVVEEAFPNNPVEMATFLPLLMENLSVNPDPSIPGRININQAPLAVLMGIPGLDFEAANAIISERSYEPDANQPNHKYETWLLTESIVTLEEMKQLMPFVTAGGSVYRAQLVGFSDEQGPTARVEAIFDNTQGEPQMLFWRDLSQLGQGYDLTTLGAGLTN